ncbi:MAG TPA: YhfC family intramembrane metalloprotease [Anaerolineae bacterium]|nr:YhfC family intramembrane metalloprotease [Anaerolineae bacterium]
MTYLVRIVQTLLMLGLPAGLWLWMRRRLGAPWGLIGAGMLTFVLSQAVHLPLNWALGLLGGERGVALWPVPWTALVVGLSAGVCEEGARYVVLRLWRREARSWRDGVAFGAGHGGIEALLLGLLVLLTLVQMIALQRMDLEGLGLSGEMLEQVQAQIDTYWSVPWYLPLLGGLERASALAIQIALTLIVVRALTHNVGWLGLAILAHTLVDGLAVGLLKVGWPIPAIEGVVFLLALAAVVFIVIARREERPVAAGDVSRETSPPFLEGQERIAEPEGIEKEP